MREPVAGCDSPLQSSVHVPCYRPNSTTVRKWLELRCDQGDNSGVNMDDQCAGRIPNFIQTQPTSRFNIFRYIYIYRMSYTITSIRL